MAKKNDVHEISGFPRVAVIDAEEVFSAVKAGKLPAYCVTQRVDLQGCHRWAHKGQVPAGRRYGLEITR